MKLNSRFSALMMMTTTTTAVALLLCLSTLPVAVQADGWSLAPPSLSSLIDENDSDESSFQAPFLRKSSYPHHEIVDTAHLFQITFDLQDVPTKDIEVLLENNGMVLVVQGHREVQGEAYRYQGSFKQRFSLSSEVQSDQMVATRRGEDGALIITAPKYDVSRGRPSRAIPIQDLNAIEASMNRSFFGALPSVGESAENKKSDNDQDQIPDDYRQLQPPKSSAFVNGNNQNQTEQQQQRKQKSKPSAFVNEQDDGAAFLR